jgi:hypothetical protein
MGVQVWMDTKELYAGETVIESISRAIETADMYVVALSDSSLNSKWVAHELNTALSLEVTQGHPHVVPVLLTKVAVPAVLQSKLYLDLADIGLSATGQRLLESLRRKFPELTIKESKAEPDIPSIQLGSVTLQLRQQTNKSYGGPLGDAFSKKEVEAEASDLVRELRRRANGVLLNFVQASEMDFSSPHPRFPNGEIISYTSDSGGEFVGTISKKAIVEVRVLSPDEKKLAELVSTKLESLGVNRATYSFLLSTPISGLAQRALSKLQNSYVLLGWDPNDGADVELPDDLRLSVFCDDETIRLSVETKYSFQFQKRAKEFSVREFVGWLVKV